jgi:hypothetical protein
MSYFEGLIKFGYEGLPQHVIDSLSELARKDKVG